MRSFRWLAVASVLVCLPSLAFADERPTGPRRDAEMFDAGIASIVAGGVSVVAGSTMLFVGSSAIPIGCAANGMFACPSANPALEWAGAILLGVGLVATIAGLPMILIGGKHHAAATAMLTPFGVIGRF